MTGYDRRQLARAERLLEDALQQVVWARTRLDDEPEVLSRCLLAEWCAGDARGILDRTVKRIDRRRAAS